MRRLILCSAILMLSGCGLLSQPKPQSLTLYQLTPSQSSSAVAATAAAPGTAPVCAQVLRVRGVEASPPFAGDSLLYSETPQVLGAFAWHRWATPPATMLTGDILDEVSASGLYRAVLGPTDPGEADWALAIRINSGPLQIFSQGKGSSRTSSEQLSYTATLANAGDGHVLGTRVFSASRAADPTPYGGVQATNAIVAQLNGQLLTWLRQLSANADCK
ncbi:MAG: ABC-type transport auxiliary lipoprotein family protein [Gammaproteobacteria bacterium]